jgi:hypothetical protein
MENYEINILKRNGEWKRISPEVPDKSFELNNVKPISNSKTLKKFKKKAGLLSNINEVKLIIDKIENLENEKNKLKNELKEYEMFFLENKANSEKELSQVSKELEMFDKAIEIIKKLKKI